MGILQPTLLLFLIFSTNFLAPMSYLSVSNLSSSSSPTLRRSGAIRKPLPPLRHLNLSESGAGELLNIECREMAASTEKKPIQRRVTEGDLSSRDGRRGHRNRVFDMERPCALEANDLIECHSPGL